MWTMNTQQCASRGGQPRCLGHTRKNSGGAYRVRFTPKERTSSGHAGSAAWGPQAELPYSFCLKATPSLSVAAQRNVEMRSGVASRFWLVKPKELADLILGS
jgi:hypothetical protein